MLRPDQAAEVIERVLQSGEDRREKIVDAVALLIDSDHDALKRLAADKLVSLALATMRDDSDERLAYPSRNEEGERTVVHMTHTRDPRALLRCGKRMQRQGKSIAAAGDRLVDRALQLDAFELAGV